MAQLALRFILSNPDVTTVIPGTRRPEHLGDTVAAAEAGRRGSGAGDPAVRLGRGAPGEGARRHLRGPPSGRNLPSGTEHR